MMKIKRFLQNSKGILLELGETFIVSALVILIIYAVIASIETVWGPSMEPTYYSGEKILVEKITKRYKPLERGEVVVFNPPNNKHKHYIKRVIALPGEIVKVYDCKVYISNSDGKSELVEDYLKEGECTLGGTFLTEGRSRKLGEDEYIMMGDNRGYSLDSRSIGVIKSDTIIGRVIFRFWPPTKFGFAF